MPLMDWLAAVDPTIAYVGLILALWSLVTIVYTPGTIIGEIASAVLAIGTLAVLSALPTNWLAVGVVIVGVSTFLALPFISARYARYAEVGLILQLIGGLMLFNGAQASPPIVIATTLLAWAYHRLVLLPALAHHVRVGRADESQMLVGMRGRVLRALDPVGTVYVNGESWTARSDEPLDADTDVVVLRMVGLELHVEKAKREEAARANGYQH